MRQRTLGTTHILAGLLLITGVCFFTPTASAQGGPGGPHPRAWGGPGGPGGFGGRGFAKVVTGEPYTAQAVTTMQQTLADGTNITRTVTASIARDPEGRTMRSQTMSGFGNGGAANGTTIVTIFDPVAHERIEYNSARKTARIFMLPQNQGAQGSGGFQGRAGRGMRGNRSSQATVATQSLPAKMLDGFSVQGTQTTRTIAAGSVGNDKPLVSTEETWYSSDLQMVLQSTRNDPRFGQTTYTVSNLQQGEPSASLFQVPAGYQTRTVEPPSRHSTQ